MWSRWEVTSTLSFSQPPFIFQSSEPWLVLWRTPLITSSTQVVSLNRLPTYELLRWSQYSRGQVHCPPGSMHSPRESETQRHQDLTPLRASSSKHSLSCPDGKGSTSSHQGSSAWRLFTLDLKKEQSFGCSPPWPDTSWPQKAVLFSVRFLMTGKCSKIGLLRGVI